jgi:drug/metabolite transporter (DMT)-like permease
VAKVERLGGTPARRPVDDVSLGILLFVVGLSCGSIQGGIAKLLVADLPVPIVLWWRFLGLLSIVLPFAAWRYGVEALTPRRPWLHILRAVLLVSSSVLFTLSVIGLPLADTIAIVFVYPFIITALAPALLGERLDPASAVAVVTGFIGVMVVIRPGFEGFNIYGISALLCGATFALGLIATRKFLVAAPPTVTATWTAGTAVIVFGIAMPWFWVTPSESQLGLLLLLGGISAFSQIATITACSKCDMGVLAPFGYTEIVAATLTGLVMFADFPDWITWSGIAIIVTSGLTIAFAKGGRLPLISRSRPPGSH